MRGVHLDRLRAGAVSHVGFLASAADGARTDGRLGQLPRMLVLHGSCSIVASGAVRALPSPFRSPAPGDVPKAVYARSMSFFARVTRPLAKLDGPVNRLNDLAVRVTPWAWWPASPPRRDRPYDAGQHAAYLAWSAAGFLVGDVLAQRMPEEQRSTGRRLRNERIATGLMSAATWLVAAGAWDRRAERLRRRPWQRRR